jgi:hypothetical protein
LITRTEQTEVAWSKFGAVRRIVYDFPLLKSISNILHIAPPPDLAPSDFDLFGPLKHPLVEHLPDDEAVEREVTA